MITRKLSLDINGESKEIEIRFNLRDWANDEHAQYYGIKQTQWFTHYEPSENCTLVDFYASTWYIELACIFKQIYLLGEYKELIPDLSEDGDERRAQVERFIISIAGPHREEYIRARHAMYNEILSCHACATRERIRILHAAVMLEQQGVRFFQ